MKKVVLLLFVIVCSLVVGYSQSYDKKIADAINSGDWFALDSIYKVSPTDSISDFLEVYSRAMIGNRFNRPEESIPAFEELLENHYQELNLNQLVGVVVMCAIDLSRVGDNAKASLMLSEVHDKIMTDGNVKTASKLDRFIKQYSALSGFNPYTIKMQGDTGRVEFTTVPIGNPDDEGVHIHLSGSSINGVSADIVFDTGAGVNVVSPEMVDNYQLIPVDAETTVSGAKLRNGTLAIAKKVEIGNITVCDVPFYVMDITANNVEADQHMKSMKIIVGSDLMLQLKDVTIDFETSHILVPARASAKTETTPNICFSLGMNLLAKGNILGDRLLMNVDTGDSSYGSIGGDFYKRHKKYIKSHGTKAKLRTAGIGGVQITNGYKVKDLTLVLGGNTVAVPTFNVMQQADGIGGHECNLGLKSLMLYKTVRFNLIDFVLTTTPLK